MHHRLADPDLRVAILGLGSMGRAILNGLLAPELERSFSVAVTNASAASASQWDAHPHVTAYAVETHPDANRRALEGARVVIAAVKPWLMTDLLAEIGPALEPGTIVVSVAAGIPTSTLERALPEHVAVLRAMPNTPALIGRGVTGVCAGSNASDADTALVRELFAAVGDVVVVDETQMDALGALSGSGPAYVFYFAEQLLAAAHNLGFSQEDARTLVLGTLSGAAELLIDSGEDPAALRRQVTSPNGTTEQAIATFERGELGALVSKALDAAIRRSQEIADELS